MVTKDYIITAAEGIHARPATALVKLTRQYKSAISLKKGERIILLNSMLNILSLGAKGGDTISIMVNGEDEAEAMAAIDVFFNEQLQHL